MLSGPPLPEHPELRSVAEAFETAKISGEILDANWCVVFISSEEARIIGVEPSEVGRFYGKGLPRRQLEDAEYWATTDDSSRDRWKLNVPIMRNYLEPGGHVFDAVFGPLASAAARVEAGEPHVWRVAVPEDRGDIVFDDAIRGEVRFPGDAMDDFILVRTDGSPTYNYATVVDDWMMEMTHIIRGDDHLSNTPRQIVVFEALEAPVPTFAHMSLIFGTDGKRLSKRHGATAVGDYQDQGILTAAMRNFLALLGW